MFINRIIFGGYFKLLVVDSLDIFYPFW